MRDHITLKLNGRYVEVRGISPTTTALAWLRLTQHATGTKEGCGAGDCGACTIVIGDLRDGAVSYRPLNACIALVAHLEGSVITMIEGLAGPTGDLHPVQQAMVDCHGSQCGFCTPGIVMSLYALYLAHATPPSRDAIIEALGGNLCRCTGYGPIIEAAERMFALPRPVWDIERRARDRIALQQMRHGETVTLSDATATIHLPATLDALCDLAAAMPDATIVSGATDVGLWITKQGRQLSRLIGTSRVTDQPFVSVADVLIDGAARRRAGGGVCVAALADEGAAFCELIARFAGPQVRATGTVGGNIANGSPIGDLAPALIALDAAVTLRHGRLERRIPLEQFFIAYGRQDRRPGEVLVALDWSKEVADLAIYKVSKRFEDDISAVCGAFNIRIADGRIALARIAFGGMAAIPKRAHAVETALIGKPWSRATIDAALPAFECDFQPISDMRASAEYRIQVAKNLLVRAYVERSAVGVATRLPLHVTAAE